MQVAPAEESNKVSKLSLSSYGCKTRDVYQEGKSSGVKRGGDRAQALLGGIGRTYDPCFRKLRGQYKQSRSGLTEADLSYQMDNVPFRPFGLRVKKLPQKGAD
jgi:hypothetical protein